MTTTLNNNAFVLAKLIGQDRHCEPASMVCRDGHHKGTMFSWFEGEWIVTDLENREFRGVVDRLAVVTLDNADPDYGLNQAALGIDLECGEWVIDAEDLIGLQCTYGDSLVVKWVQDA